MEQRPNLSGTIVCHEALISGQIDSYVEYTGTALTTVLKRKAINDSAEVFKQVKDDYGTATVLANQAKLYERQGNYPAAMDGWQAALVQFDSLANPSGIAHALLGLGREPLARFVDAL